MILVLTTWTFAVAFLAGLTNLFRGLFRCQQAQVQASKREARRIICGAVGVVAAAVGIGLIWGSHYEGMQQSAVNPTCIAIWIVGCIGFTVAWIRDVIRRR